MSWPVRTAVRPTTSRIHGTLSTSSATSISWYWYSHTHWMWPITLNHWHYGQQGTTNLENLNVLIAITVLYQFFWVQAVVPCCNSHLGQTAQICPCLPLHWSTHCHNRPPHWRHPPLLCPLWHLPRAVCDLLLGGVWRWEGGWTTIQFWAHQGLPHCNHGVSNESYRWISFSCEAEFI